MTLTGLMISGAINAAGAEASRAASTAVVRKRKRIGCLIFGSVAN
jgi:hypothetical protein